MISPIEVLHAAQQLQGLIDSPTAKKYQGDLPWVDLDRRMKDLASKNWFQALRLPPEERFTRFAADERELTLVLNEIQHQIDHQKAQRGYDEFDALSYGLGPIQLRLAQIRLEFEELSKQVSVAPKP